MRRQADRRRLPQGREAGQPGKCVKIPDVSIHCLPGYVQKGKTCVKKPVIVDACKRGEQRINGRCVKKPEVSILCKKGFKLVGKEVRPHPDRDRGLRSSREAWCAATAYPSNRRSAR